MAAIISGVAACPRMAVATSPGRISVAAKTRSDVANNVSTPKNARLRTRWERLDIPNSSGRRRRRVRSRRRRFVSCVEPYFLPERASDRLARMRLEVLHALGDAVDPRHIDGRDLAALG